MKLCLTVILFFLSHSTVACPKLTGTWKNSLHHFIEFNDRWAKGEKRFRFIHEQAQGKTTVEYRDDGEMSYIMEPREMERPSHSGKEKIEIPGFKEETKYEILGCTDRKIAIKYKLRGTQILTLLYFHGNNKYFEYKGDPRLSGHDHIREYFVRVN